MDLPLLLRPPSVLKILNPAFLRSRLRGPEWMDEPGADPEQLRKSLGYLRRINGLLRYTRSTLSHLERFSRGWKPVETIRILDVATGSADLPRAILKWAKGRGLDVRVVGIDLHAMTARAAGADDAVRVVQANAMQLPFADGSFDYATTSLFLHHLDEADVVKVLAEMGRVAGRGVIVGDLLRHRRAYFWVNILTSLANPMVRHDGRISVAQAFKRGEIIALRDRAGISFATYHRHFGHRFVLAGERPSRE
jgi:2-polyprenyl-3-methyl-5-hydroxy-6-metoxy-1,4-benzoquinol methylase